MQESGESPLGPSRNKQPDTNTKLKLVQLSYRAISLSRSSFKAVPLVSSHQQESFFAEFPFPNSNQSFFFFFLEHMTAIRDLSELSNSAAIR